MIHARIVQTRSASLAAFASGLNRIHPRGKKPRPRRAFVWPARPRGGRSEPPCCGSRRPALRGAHGGSFGEVLDESEGLLRRQSGAVQRGALALGGAGIAGAAVEQPILPGLAVMAAVGQVAVPRLP